MHDPFREYQEWQAEQFAFHFRIPTFMLNQLELPQLRCEAVGLIATLFNVEHTFANLKKYLCNIEFSIQCRTGSLYLRRNNKNIFKQLQELGSPGSYRTVCNFSVSPPLLWNVKVKY